MATVQVRYIVENVETAIEFYTEQLGFELEMHPAPAFAMLSRGDLRLLAATVERLRKAGAYFRNEMVTGVSAKQILWRIPPAIPSNYLNPSWRRLVSVHGRDRPAVVARMTPNADGGRTYSRDRSIAVRPPFRCARAVD